MDAQLKYGASQEKSELGRVENFGNRCGAGQIYPEFVEIVWLKAAAVCEL